MSTLPRIERNGDSWVFAWDEFRVGMGVERLQESRDGLHAEVTVESTMPGPNGRILGPVRLNVLSSESQTRFANVLDKRDPATGWATLVTQACALVAKQYREPSPTLRLCDLEDEGPVEYLVPLLLPKGDTTILFGDGQSGKSLLALRIALSVATGVELPWGADPGARCNVLILDWETTARTVRSRLKRLAWGMALDAIPETIHYRGVARGAGVLRGLDDELPNIRADVSKMDIGLVIVDSIGFACNGPLNEDQTARSALNALRLMAPATRLVVAHVSNESARQTSGATRPFGSAFFWNGMRSGVEVRQADDAGNGLDIGLYHRKANDNEHHKPIGLRVEFGEKDGPIYYQTQDVQDVPELAVRTPLSARIRALLTKGAQDTLTLAEALDAKPESVTQTLRRMPDVRRQNEGTGRGVVAKWGLLG